MRAQIDYSEKARGADKVSRYGWVKRDAPGQLQMLHKDALQVQEDYQREPLQEKVKAISADWSWLSFGALVVGERDGAFWVIDGQHRFLAAKRRSDIDYLPCVVFQTVDVKTEAKGFLDLNTGRKPVSAIAKHKAMVSAGNEVAIFVNDQIAQCGLKITRNGMAAKTIKCIAWCISKASEDAERFSAILKFCAELSDRDGIQVAERLLEGVWILDNKCGEGLADNRLRKKLQEKGAKRLLDAVNRACAYYAKGGGRIWAQGMLEEINKGLQNKFSFVRNDD